MLDNNFKIKLKMLSDWQVGTGTGIPGNIDELISRDADGFPQVPAKTLVGIWRDAMERLCDGLGGKWSDWVEVIFGSQPNIERNPKKIPVPAILSLQSARIPENLRAKIGNDVRLKQALTFTKVGVKIDGKSGTSAPDMLRFEEMGRIGTVLESNVHLEKSNEVIESLLILSAKLIERIGGKRRRGSGRCKLEIVGISKEKVKEATRIIRTLHNDETKFDELLRQTREKPDEQSAENFEVSPNDSRWKSCEYTLTLETPVSIVTAVLSNVSETLDFIPGTYLISYFTKHFGQAIFRHIQNGDFQISPATISIDGQRSFPVPNVFVQEKMNESSVFNVLDDRRTKDTPQTKPIKGGFCIEKNGKFLYATTPQTILMHNSVNDEFQRPTQEEGGIYARHAIKAGTIFKGEIRFRNFFGEQPDFSKLKGKVRIGTSKKDDYGLAKIEFGEVRNFERQSTEKNGEITVYLASDVMLRNENLRQSNLAEDLAAAIGLDKNTEITFQNIQVRRIESWQVSWGFPRPTLTLMQAGSVVRFKTNKKIDIATSEAEGIGERRGEGYGKIIFNPKFLEIQKPVWEKKNADKLVISDAGAEIEDKEFAKLIEKIAWQRELKLAVSKIAAEDAQKSDYNAQIFGFKGLTMSQIGGLRSVIMRLQSKSDIPIVENWLSHLEKTANRLDSWGKGRIEKIKNLLKDNAIWETLGENFRTPSPIAEGSNLKDELWAEAMKSLFYACQLAHKRELEKGGKS